MQGIYNSSLGFEGESRQEAELYFQKNCASRNCALSGTSQPPNGGNEGDSCAEHNVKIRATPAEFSWKDLLQASFDQSLNGRRADTDGSKSTFGLRPSEFQLLRTGLGPHVLEGHILSKQLTCSGQDLRVFGRLQYLPNWRPSLLVLFSKMHGIQVVAQRIAST